MATAKKTDSVEVEILDDIKKEDDGYVDFPPLFYDGDKYKEPLPVIINGKKYSVPRGVPLRLPKVVAEVIAQSTQQDAYAAALDRELQKPQTLSLD